MANKKGPTEKKRRLYQNVLNLVMLYGAPLWADEVNLFPKVAKEIWVIQRKIALRVIKAYRTVSLEMALMLARCPPVELQAGKLRALYFRKTAAKEKQIKLTESGLRVLKKQEHDKMMKKWRNRLADKANRGGGIDWEILSCLTEWEGRNHGELTYQMTQLIMGHGFFRGYTHRIGKASDSKCSFCGHTKEDNRHVLLECEEWREERETLKTAYGGKMESLGAMLRGMAADPHKWDAALEFSRKIMDRKEEVEREEQTEERYVKLIRSIEEILGGGGVDAGRRRELRDSQNDPT